MVSIKVTPTRNHGKLFIVGATGYVGTHLLNHFRMMGLSPIILGRTPHGHFTEFKHIDCDITHPTTLESLLSQNDRVINLACIPLRQSHENPDLSQQVNLEGALNIAKALQKNNGYLLNISTSEVYGVQKQLPVKETAVCHPVSVYGKHKLEGELACHSLAKSGPLTATTLRLTNLVGPDLNGGIRPTVESIFIANLLANKKIRVHSGERNSRDFLNINDACKAITYVSTLPDVEWRKLNAETINIGSGVETTLNQLAHVACSITGKNFEALVENQPSEQEPTRFAADIRKASNLLGFVPAYSLQQSLKSILDVTLKS